MSSYYQAAWRHAYLWTEFPAFAFHQYVIHIIIRDHALQSFEKSADSSSVGVRAEMLSIYVISPCFRLEIRATIS